MGYIIKGSHKQTTLLQKPIIGKHLSDILMHNSDVEKILSSIKTVILKRVPVFVDYFVENFYFVCVITPAKYHQTAVYAISLHSQGKLTGLRALKILSAYIIKKQKNETIHNIKIAGQ